MLRTGDRVGDTVEGIFVRVEDHTTIEKRADGLRTFLHIPGPQFQVAAIVFFPVFVEVNQ